MTDVSATTAEAEPEPRRRIGRPAEREIPRTKLDEWLVQHEVSSVDFQRKCARVARRHHLPLEYIPSRASIDDLRVARFYPSLIVARIIQIATRNRVGLPEWADDIQRIGTRSARHPRPK